MNFLKYKRLIVALLLAVVVSLVVFFTFSLAIHWILAISVLLLHFFYYLDLNRLKAFMTPKIFGNMTLLFLLMLAIPAFSFILNSGRPVGSKDSQLPEQAQFKNQFLFRDNLIRLNTLLKWKLFNESAVPKVIIGQQGWLYQARESEAFQPKQAGYYPSIQLFTPQELEEWAEALEKRRQWCAERGMIYMFILTPDKSSIYPEFLPQSLQAFYQRSRLDQLAEYLKNRSTVPILNLKDILLQSKSKQPLYYKTDSHWNEYGACIASAAIFHFLKHQLALPGEIQPHSIDDYRLRKRKPEGGNLAVMLTMEHSVFKEDKLKLMPRFKSSAQKRSLKKLKSLIPKTLQPYLTISENAFLPNVVMMHDSFGRKLKFFLSEYFTRILYLRDWGFGFHRRLLQQEKPRIVINEIAEHFLYNRRIL